MRTFNRFIKITSAVTLFFFCWSFLPIYSAVAFAAAPQGKGAGSRSLQAAQGTGSRGQGPVTSGEKFEKALETIRENVSRAGDKEAKSQDITAEVAEVKKQRAEIESADVEFKKEFAATEKKLKDANLPKEILDRQAKFVKHYEDNLAELKANLAGIEQGAGSKGFKEALAKAKAHLEKTKAPSRHQKLDPNNLPNRMVKAKKEKAPRLKKEEFEKDFPQKKKNSIRTAGTTDEHPRLSHSGTGLWTRIETNWERVAAGFSLRERANQEPILLAYNGDLSDLGVSLPSPATHELPLPIEGEGWREGAIPPFALSTPQWNSPNSELNTPNYQVAQATVELPTAADLSETPEVQFTPEIQALAALLNHSPVKIYEWVRNNIEFVPTYGSIQGTDMCLQSKQCNDFDTASLLIALLRSSGVYAHYSYGTIEVPIDKLINWTGGFTDAATALNFIASGGVPVTGLRSGGKIYAAQIEHVWVKAWIDYIPSMGAVHKQGDTWIPLDASYKQNTYTDGVDFQTAVPFDGQTLADQIKATATINESESSVTNVNSAFIETALSDYNTQLENYVTQNLPNATTGDILGKKEIIKKEQPILPASLPYKVIVDGTETSEVPAQLRHKIIVQLTDADNPGSPAFTYTTSLPQLAGKRFTISYDPATDADQATINNYIQQYATSMPAYLVQFKPVLKIEGTTVATGATVGMGTAQNLTISIISPNRTEIVTHNLLAGDYTAVGINPSTISADALNNRINKNDFSEPVGEMLHQTALSYWAEADAFNHIIAKTLRVNNFRHPSELAASAKVSVSYIYGVPSSATYNRRNIDVKLDSQTVTTKSTDKTNEFYYMQQSGTTSSFLEGAILDQLFIRNIGDSISAVTALKAANDQGIPIYRINSSNIAAILPQLQVSDAIKTETSNAINAGLAVQIPQTNITLNGWTGTGYIVSNPIDGSGAYRISGGLNGSDSGTGVATVIALPQIPATWSMAFLTNGLLAETGTGIQMAAGTTVMEGIAIGGGGAAGTAGAVGAAIVLAKIAAIILIAVLIYTIAKAILDKMLPRYEVFRHYTTFAGRAEILETRFLRVSLGGAIGPGAYVTKTVWLDPADPANVVQIQMRLGMSSDKIQTYIDLRVNVNKVIVTYGVPFGFPDQCTLNMPVLGSPIPLDGDTALPM
jgi:transglutaminase-like putative cysteine protease